MTSLGQFAVTMAIEANAQVILNTVKKHRFLRLWHSSISSSPPNEDVFLSLVRFLANHEITRLITEDLHG
jgi:hypothetical protein